MSDPSDRCDQPDESRHPPSPSSRANARDPRAAARSVQPLPEAEVEPTSGEGFDLIERRREAIADLARRYGVARLEVFGSVCTADFHPNASDIDFLVTYPPGYDFGPWLARLQDLEAELAALLDRKVDLVTTSALRSKWFRREADKTRRVIYDASEVA